MTTTDGQGGILYKGKIVARIDDNGDIQFEPDVHHKVKAKVQEDLEEMGKVLKDEVLEPEPDPAFMGDEPIPNDLGDLDPILIEWRMAMWPEEKFNAFYPPARLRAIGLDSFL